MTDRFQRFGRNLIAAFHDATMAALSFMLAVYIRLGDEQIDHALPYLGIGTLVFTLVCISVFVSMRLYQGLWRYASMRDLVAITKAVTLSVLVFAAMMFLLNRLEGIPRSVLFINWLLLLAMLGAPRFAYRAFKDRTLSWKLTMNEVVKIPVLLVGANDEAEQFIRDNKRDWRSPYEVVGLVDDNPARKGRTIHDIKIYGNTSGLPKIVHKLEKKGRRPQKLIVSDPAIPGERMRALLEVADSLGIPLARLPRLSEFKQGHEKADVRPIAVEDLLGRPQNVLDREAMRKLIGGKRVLVTGAGGTIGGELARQIAGYHPAALTIIELSEYHLYQIERELRASFPHLSLTTVLCDVRDQIHVDTVFEEHKPELAFHAAAIKHVPIAEFNIEETVLTNVLGTRHIAEACVKHHVGVMVMISTDKAVNPTNVMGASKRLAESFCQALGKMQEKTHITKFVTVRFGNVLGSTGSVVPLFTEQLAKGGPLTVTDPEMTRYFMTVREAVELVLQASVLGDQMQEKQEYIFVLDMGKPVKILDLALQLIRLAGLKPYEDIDIIFTGLRPGEKLFEELFYSGENSAKTAHTSIFLASPRATDMAALLPPLTALLEASKQRRTREALELLKQLVPEFKAMQ